MMLVEIVRRLLGDKNMNVTIYAMDFLHKLLTVLSDIELSKEQIQIITKSTDFVCSNLMKNLV